MLRSYGSCAVAFSAGVDSSLVAKAAHVALGDRAIAVTGVSPSLAQGELERAQELAQLIGIRHQAVATAEFQRPEYTANDTDRCFYCKDTLYEQLLRSLRDWNVGAIVNGLNADDLTDYRPGRRAATLHGVQSPLAACGIGKQDVRDLARDWGLPVWDRPASPCLASRVAYGEEVTTEKLARIDAAERYLRAAGLGELRVRHHAGELARIEVPLGSLDRFASAEFRQQVVNRMRELGFRYVTLDLEGFRSGNLNDVIPVDVLRSSGATDERPK